MDFVVAVPKYFEMVSQDVQYLVQTKEGEKDYLIVSVALRVLGGFLAFNTVRSIVAGLVNPLTLMGCVASAVIAFVLASDLIKIGNGMRVVFEENKKAASSDEGKKEKLAFSWDMGKGDGFAPGFHDTILIKQVHALWMYTKGLLERQKNRGEKGQPADEGGAHS